MKRAPDPQNSMGWKEVTVRNSFFHFSEGCNIDKIFTALQLHQGEVLFVPGWRTCLARQFLQEPPTADAPIAFSGHGIWLNKRPVHNLQTANPVKSMRKWMCSKACYKFQSLAETAPRYLINIQISNQYFNKIRV